MDNYYIEKNEGVRLPGTVCSNKRNIACENDDGRYKDDRFGRICRSCKEWKTWNEFDKKKTGKNGYDSRCKICISKSKKKKNEIQKKNKQKRNKSRNSRETTVLDFSQPVISEEWLPVVEGSDERILGDYIGDVICKRVEVN